MKIWKVDEGCFILQVKGMRIMFELPTEVSSLLALSSLSAILVSSVASLARLPALLSSSSLPVYCTTACAQLGVLLWQEQGLSLSQCRLLLQSCTLLSLLQPVSLSSLLLATPLPSGRGLGDVNWRLSCAGREVGVLAPGGSSLWHNRHAALFDPAVLSAPLVLWALPAPALPSKAPQELAGLLKTGVVVVPVASLTSPLVFDLLDTVVGLAAHSCEATLVSPIAEALLTTATVLPEYHHPSRLRQAQEGGSPLLLPSVCKTLSVLSQPLQPKLTYSLFIVLASLLPSLRAALPVRGVSILSLDPALGVAAGLDSRLTAPQEAELQSRVRGQVVTLPGVPYEQRRIAHPQKAVVRAVLGGETPEECTVRLRGDGQVQVQAVEGLPSLATLTQRLETAGIYHVQIREEKDERTLTFPGLANSRLEMNMATGHYKLITTRLQDYQRLSDILKSK
jgi:hypothetical protein